MSGGFIEQISATPDDPAPYLIYADELQQQGDPRGDLISIQHALETADWNVAADLRRREADLIDKHPEWLGKLLENRDALAIRWRNGFVHAARVLAENDDDEQRAALRALCEMPALAELRIGSPETQVDEDDWDPCQKLVDDPWPASLRRLYICDADLRGMSLAPSIRVPNRAKSLDTLVAQSQHLTLAWDATPCQLRHLELRCRNFDARPLVAIKEWPNLESLTVWTEDAMRVLLMLSKVHAPKLKRLGLCGTAQTNVIATELAKHPILAQLEHVSLAGGVLTTTKVAQALAGHVKLDVRFNLLGKDERTKLKAFGAVVQPQRRGDKPLTDHVELMSQQEYLRGRLYDVDDEKGFKKHSVAPDPCWLYEATVSVADRFDKKREHAIVSGVAAACRVELVHAGDTDRADLYLSLADTCEELALHHEAECWLWQAVNEARWREDGSMEIRALGHIGTIRMRRGDPTNAVPIMDRVLAYYLEEGNKSQQAWALRQRGNVDLVRSEYTTAEPFYRRALEIYREQKDKNNEGIVLSELAGVLWSRQDFEGAVAILKESILMRDEGSIGLGSCYYNLGAVLNGMGRLEEAIDAGQKALAVFRKHNRGDGIGQSLSLLGELEQRSNRHAEAEKLLEEALANHRERGALRETGITLGNLSRVALDRAQWAKAKEYCEEAVELHREVGNKYNEGMQLLGLIDAAIGERRLDEALALTDLAMRPLVAINNLPAIAAIKLRRGYIAQLRADYPTAEKHYDEACADTTRGNYPEIVGWSHLYRAVIRALQRRRADADALIADARPILANSIMGMLSLAMTEAVIAKISGERVTLPEPTGWDSRLIATFAT